MAQRKAYFEWFLKAAHYKGGASFDNFVKNIKNEAVAALTDEQRAELKPVESELGREAEELEAAERERRSAPRVVRRVAGERRIVHAEQEPPDPERLQRAAHQGPGLAHFGSSQTTPSGGSVIAAEAGCPSHAVCSAWTRPWFPTPDPPYSPASLFTISTYSPASGRPTR